MCRFKKPLSNSSGSSIAVSIHPMCRFKDIYDFTPNWEERFQYILCVGSRLLARVNLWILCCFNTSYVSVQVKMVLHKRHIDQSFNTSYVSVQVVFLTKIFLSVWGFNTSYVSVQGLLMLQKKTNMLCFNTSYVSVQVNTELEGVKNRAFQYILCVGSSF